MRLCEEDHARALAGALAFVKIRAGRTGEPTGLSQSRGTTSNRKVNIRDENSTAARRLRTTMEAETANGEGVIA